MKQDLSSGKTVRMSRRANFSSAHLYANAKFSEHENKSTFGKCFTEHGHGHNYLLEAFFEGRIDEQTGLIINLLDIDELLKVLIDKLDHQHLNFDVAEFRDLVPTTENLARFCFQKIEELRKSKMPQVKMRLYKVRLFENEDIWAEFGVNA
jgi:6-pyruvoyltetrahydropterin/6-carboxytetrahydropterin synthase